jgi:hypothetical protein
VSENVKDSPAPSENLAGIVRLFTFKKSMSEASKQPHPLGDLLLTVVFPSLVLEYLSKPDKLGPAWALFVALLLPAGFGVWCFIQKRGLNFFSIFGLIAVIVTGGLGLLKLDPVWFAAKEAAFPTFLGLAFPLSFRWGRPLISELLLNPQVINVALIQKSLDTSEKSLGFQVLMSRASWGMALTMFGSAVANFALAWYLLNGKLPGGEDYTKAIGRLNWVSFIVIGIPLIAATMTLLFWMMRGISQLTGLERDDFMNGGQTVRRQVRRTP